LARTPKTAPEAILSALKRGPRRGLAATVIAERAGTNLNTTRTTLGQLRADGLVEVADTDSTGLRGRPANLYIVATA
jgi:predicted ArsR family transcriptional regulator